jgi:hypothetical protein
MNCPKRYCYLCLTIALPLVSLLAGCGASPPAYAPTSDEARTSLETALTAWRDGKPCGPIAGTPSIEVMDPDWQAGQQIASFEIGEQQDNANGTKLFVVTAKMKKPPGDKSFRYVIYGRGPVWVCREEEYIKMSNMDGAVPKSPAQSAGRRSDRRR